MSNNKYQKYLEKLSIWTKANLIKFKADNPNFTVVNFTDDYKFNTKLSLENIILEEVSEARLLGVVINHKQELILTSNIEDIAKTAYKIMIILNNLF